MNFERRAYFYEKLTDDLWVGNANAAQEYFAHSIDVGPPRDGIKSVISPAADCVAIRGIVYNRHLSVLLMPFADHDPISAQVAESIIAFHRAHAPTFVHCAAGANRSLAVASILLIDKGWTLDQAFEKCWPWCDGIRQSVEAWYEELYGGRKK